MRYINIQKLVNRFLFSSLTRRIFLFNLIGLIIMLSSILYLNIIGNNLIAVRAENLKVEGIIIANAISQTNDDIIFFPPLEPEELLAAETSDEEILVDNDDYTLNFPINPVRISPLLRDFTYLTRTRAKIFDEYGMLIFDDKYLYDITNVPIYNETIWTSISVFMKKLFFIGDFPLHIQHAPINGFNYAEIRQALSGTINHTTRQNEHGQTIIFVAVPIERNNKIIGALHMSTMVGDIDDMIRDDQLAIINIFFVTSIVTLFLSMILAYTIASPLRKLSLAAERVKLGIKGKQQIPDFSIRQDEIGHLSTALQDMTKALYHHIENIESFAADVSHELKNPLTSLRSAVEALPISADKKQQKKLLEIIAHDVLRLDRLISDISDASRLDAELARQTPKAVDLENLLQDFCNSDVLRCQTTGYQPIRLHVPTVNKKKRAIFIVRAEKNRLAQVLANIIDNARSICSKKNGRIDIILSQTKTKILIEIKDNGPGIDPANFEKIFARFYTDRPAKETFGQNSGLGLSIARQIIEAHNGKITAENDIGENGKINGAYFKIYLPKYKN